MTEINTDTLPAKTPTNGAATTPIEGASEGSPAGETQQSASPVRRRGRGTRTVPVVGGNKGQETSQEAASEGSCSTAETGAEEGQRPSPPAKKTRKPRKPKAAAAEPTQADFAVYGRMVFEAKQGGYDLSDRIEEMRTMIAVYDLVGE
jgi:hypothetical protein